MWLKPRGKDLSLRPLNGTKDSSSRGVEGGHPETMKSGWMANTRRSGGDWPQVLLSEVKLTPSEAAGSNLRHLHHHICCVGSAGVGLRRNSTAQLRHKSSRHQLDIFLGALSSFSSSLHLKELELRSLKESCPYLHGLPL